MPATACRRAVRSFGAALATGARSQDVEAWPERIGAVTAAAGQCRRRHVFDPSARSPAGCAGAAAGRGGLRRAGRRPPAPAIGDREINAGGAGRPMADACATAPDC